MMVLLRMGDVTGAREFSASMKSGGNKQDKTKDKIIDALCTTAEGEYEAAAKKWKGIVDSENGSDESGLRTMACQNLAVCLVYMGKVTEAQDTLRGIMDDEQQHLLKGVSFNLATIYELVADVERCRALKLELAEEAKKKAEGDRALGDFKL